MKNLSTILLLMILPLIAGADPANPADPGSWQVTPNNYQYSMTVTSVLVFGMEESRDMGDKIAAFVGDDCRGVASPITYIPSDDRYIANLMVYSNETSGDTVTIFMYDQSEDEIVEVAEKLPFSANATFGKTDNPYFSMTTYNVTFLIQNEGNPMEGAEVSLEGYGTQSTDAEGAAAFEDVSPDSSLQYTILAEGFDTVVDSLAVTNQNVTKTLDLNPTAFDVTFSVINGETPVQNAQVSLEGYGSKTTDVFGEAVFREVLPQNSIPYRIEADRYNPRQGNITVTYSDENPKITLSYKTYAATFSLHDGKNPIGEAVVSLEQPGPERVEDFNHLAVPNYFNSSGNNSWIIDTSEVFTGIHALKSGAIYDNQSARIEFQEETAAGYFSFYTRVSSEQGADHLIFYIDGEEKGRWSGETGWKKVRFTLNPGTHTFQWVYKKDGSRSDGGDGAWIDYIQYPAESNYYISQTSNNSGEAVFENLLPHPAWLQYKINDERYSEKSDSIIVTDQNIHEDVPLNVNLAFQVTKEFDNPFSAGDSVLLENYGKAPINQQGTALFRNVTPTDSLQYQIQCSHYQMEEGYVGAWQNDTVKANLEITRHQVSFLLTYNQMPLEGLAVLLRDFGQTTSNAEGLASFQQVAPGTYAYSVEDSDYLNQSGTIALGHRDTTITLEVLPLADISFTVISGPASGSVPVAEALISLTSIDREQQTDAFGKTVFENITPQTELPFEVTAEGYEAASGTISTDAGDAERTIELTMLPQLEAANIITPNGDGKNDFWEIFNPERIQNFKVDIYSASGEKIFSTTDYPNNKWNGRKNGKSIPQGSYFYIMTSPDKSIVFKGVINLIR